jgi:hypothetical protein
MKLSVATVFHDSVLYDNFRADLYSTLAFELLLWFYHNILCDLLQIYGYFYGHYLLVLCIRVEG